MPVVKLQRGSLTTLLKEIEDSGPDAMGVISIIYARDGRAHFRISGFRDAHAAFIVCGLLDWVKADMIADLVNG